MKYDTLAVNHVHSYICRSNRRRNAGTNDPGKIWEQVPSFFSLSSGQFSMGELFTLTLLLHREVEHFGEIPKLGLPSPPWEFVPDFTVLFNVSIGRFRENNGLRMGYHSVILKNGFKKHFL